MHVRFDDPAPEFPRDPNLRSLLAETLRMNPDRWAAFRYVGRRGKGPVADQSVRQAAYTIRHGQLQAFAPAGSFEAQSREVAGEIRIYIRYVGTTDPEAQR